MALLFCFVLLDRVGNRWYNYINCNNDRKKVAFWQQSIVAIGRIVLGKTKLSGSADGGMGQLPVGTVWNPA